MEDPGEVKDEAGKIGGQRMYESGPGRAGRTEEGDRNQFSELKEANTGGCRSLKTHLQQSDGIKNSGTRMEKGSKRHEEEQQPDRITPRREGRVQEGPSSEKRLQAKRRQKEQGQEQGRATE